MPQDEEEPWPVTEAARHTDPGRGDVVTSSLLEDPDEPFFWDRIMPREISPQQWVTYQGYMAEIFEAFGMNPATPGTRRTPGTLPPGLLESTSGYEGDANLLTAFPTECRGGPTAG